MPGSFAVCFSGHRPEKLPAGPQLRMLQSLLYSEIETAIRDGADTFYTGMARGTDLWAADMVLHFRFREPERKLKLICVLPYEQQCARIRGAARYHVQTVLHAADETVCICRNYQKGCFTRRNQYMVDHSRRLIALVADTHSGTGQTIRMAERQGLELRVLNPALAEKQERPANDFFYF